MGTTVKFLLGRAGSGKTERCLTEIREELRARPEGPALLLLAPRQATFQLERRLLADHSLAGYTRLLIVSFERMAEFILAGAGRTPELLSDEGRTMVLRAILGRHRDSLEVFRASARLPGFAAELGAVLRECRRQRLDLSRVVSGLGVGSEAEVLRRKLTDLALIERLYQEWLSAHRLGDSDQLLEQATEALARPAAKAVDFQLGGLWMDGIAELTPQELHLLGAIVPRSARATLAFCMDGLTAKEDSWVSLWAQVGRTGRQCYNLVSQISGCSVVVEHLWHAAGHGRFAGAPALAALERALAEGEATPAREEGVERAVRIVVAEDPTSEAIVAAREIRRHVAAGGRFRECGIVVRQLDSHADVIRRVFRRYDIPFFIDRREAVAHHPLAEFTRGALRTVAYGWRHNDWFSALKTGVMELDEETLDRLENEALARGWEGAVWQRRLEVPEDRGLERSFEAMREGLVRPFLRLGERLGIDAAVTSSPDASPTGAALAGAIRGLWQETGVEQQLGKWSQAVERAQPRPVPMHLTVWRQMQDWLDNVELAFASERLLMREWLPILESGLSGLTAGVIPPCLDQVLVGAVDRSRNPELELAVVMGFNESLFPAPPASPALLTEAERGWLAGRGVDVGPDQRGLLSRERYYAYIALTRARRRLLVTCSRRDLHGQPLNPSSYLSWLQRGTSGVGVEEAAAEPGGGEPVHPVECFEQALAVIQPLLAARAEPCTLPGVPQSSPPAGPEVSEAQRTSRAMFDALQAWPGLCRVVERLVAVTGAYASPSLSPGVASAFYGDSVSLSVTALEKFAGCGFSHFAASLGEERACFELEARHLGTFQHDVLAAFHRGLEAEGLRWRDLTPAGARDRIRQAAEGLAGGPVLNLIRGRPQHRLLMQAAVVRLQGAIEQLVRWMATYRFDPISVEVGFGGRAGLLPAWELDLEPGVRVRFRGKIDRIDVAWPAGSTGGEAREALGVVIDYKSGHKDFDEVMFEHGLQLQLPAYLAMLQHADDLSGALGVKRIIPAGMFYLSLRGEHSAGADRLEIREEEEASASEAYQHHGRFRRSLLGLLDSEAGAKASGQFNVRLRKDGLLHSNCRDPVGDAEFDELMDRAIALIRELAARIRSGEAAVNPYRRNARLTACTFCGLESVCRIDPWTHRYRSLKGAAVEPGTRRPHNRGSRRPG